MQRCPFCTLDESSFIATNELAVAFRDSFPVAPGHSLIIPRRHVATPFELTSEEWAAIGALVRDVKASLDEEYAPDGYNLGFNVGASAGQSVWHVHLHVIPRHAGDAKNPRGGVRKVVPHARPYPLPDDPSHDLSR